MRSNRLARWSPRRLPQDAPLHLSLSRPFKDDHAVLLTARRTMFAGPARTCQKRLAVLSTPPLGPCSEAPRKLPVRVAGLEPTPLRNRTKVADTQAYGALFGTIYLFFLRGQLLVLTRSTAALACSTVSSSCALLPNPLIPPSSSVPLPIALLCHPVDALCTECALSAHSLRLLPHWLVHGLPNHLSPLPLR